MLQKIHMAKINVHLRQNNLGHKCTCHTRLVHIRIPSNIGLSRNEDWCVTEEAANIIMLVCWHWLIEVEKPHECMYHAKVFGSKEMQL